MPYKRCNVSQNLFYALQELHYMDKSKVTSSFRRIRYVFVFFWLLFPFHYHCQFVKGQLDQKSIFAFSLIEMLPSFVEAFVWIGCSDIFSFILYIFLQLYTYLAVILFSYLSSLNSEHQNFSCVYLLKQSLSAVLWPALLNRQISFVKHRSDCDRK